MASNVDHLLTPISSEARQAERYRNAVREAADGIFISNEQGVCQEVNKMGAALFGLSAEQIVGRSILDFVMEVPPAQMQADLEELRSEKVLVRERLIRRHDGTVFAAELSVTRLSDGCIEAIVRDITARKEAEDALREREERFRALAAAAFEGLCIVADGRVLDLNEQLATLFRCDRASMIGRVALEYCAPELRAIAAERMRAARGEPYEYVSVRPDGTTFESEAQSKHLLWGNRPVVVIALQDISARKNAQRALQASERRFRSYFQLPIVGVAISSPEGKWVEVNDRLCEILGYSRDELVVMTWSELTFPDDLAASDAFFLRALAGEIDGYSLEKRFIRKDGHAIYTNTSARCVRREDRKVEYFVTVIQDIAGRKTAEAERERALSSEKQAREEFTRRLLASQEAERGRIAAELHDSLGQNLLLVKNRAKLALGLAGLSTAAREQIESISELASLALAEVRQISHDLRPYQLGLTEAIEAMVRGTEQATGLAIERRLESVDEVFSKGDEINLYRIVQESLNNVIKHAGASRVRIELERDHHHIRLSIEDNGRGVDTSGQGDPGFGGFGLQSIAQRVRILGGTLEFLSAPSTGTRLAMIIPSREAP